MVVYQSWEKIRMCMEDLEDRSFFFGEERQSPLKFRRDYEM